MYDNRYNWQIYLKYNILHCPSFNEFNLNKGIKKAKQVFSNTQLITRVPRRLRVVYNINHNNKYIHICIEKSKTKQNSGFFKTLFPFCILFHLQSSSNIPGVRI